MVGEIADKEVRTLTVKVERYKGITSNIIYRLYKKGLNDAEMSQILECNRRNIIYWRRKLGLKPNTNRGGQQGHKAWNKSLHYTPKNITAFIKGGEKTRFKKGNIPHFKRLGYVPEEVIEKIKRTIEANPHEAWNKGKRNGTFVKCEICGRTVYSLPSRLRRFCSRKCCYEWIKTIGREETIRKWLKGLLKRPTSFERRLIELINEFDLPFKYVGDGELFIAYKNPDFINNNGEKILVETYYSGLHPKNYEEVRSQIFQRVGFHTIFLDENDLLSKNWKMICLNKIEEGMICAKSVNTVLKQRL